MGMCRCSGGSVKPKTACANFFILRSHKCEIIITRFHVLEKKRRSSIEPSNVISEMRCELKANRPVSERSKRANG